MLKQNNLTGNEAQDILKEILDNQKEALNLNGQLVLLNKKMDILIEKVGEQTARPKTALEAILGNSQALISIVFIILVALFLGLGDGLLTRFMGPGEIDHHQLEGLIHVIEQAAKSTAGGQSLPPGEPVP